MKNVKHSHTVFVGLSGGVDSAVSAYLLKKESFKVVGAFIKTWQPDWLPCTWKEERRDAMRVAAHLEIPLITIDLEKEYKEGVADYMISEYKKGRTPNPDVMCNKEVKFGAFLKKAMEMGADYVATGHYARVQEFKNLNFKFKINLKKSKLKTLNFKLLKAKDEEKEQSYFLWTLKQNQLEKILFPIGHLKKSEVRRIAKKIGLPNAEKKDSQGICFIGKVGMKEFLSHYIPKKRGEVLNLSGEQIGHHDGAVFYTIGERHGFDVTKKSSNDERFYVIKKDIASNTIVVGKENDLKTELSKILKEIFIQDTNWINKEPEEEKVYDAQIRYHQKLQKVRLKKEKAGWKVIFKDFQTGASGQSIVLYDKDVCLGGGVIK